MSNIVTQEFTIAASGFAFVSIPGEFFQIEDTSLPCHVEADNGNKQENLTAGAKRRPGAFNGLRIINPSVREAIKVSISVGFGDASAQFPFIPPTRLRPQFVTLLGATLIRIPGIAPAGDDTYANYGIRPGARRKEIVISNYRTNDDVYIYAINVTLGGLITGVEIDVLAAGERYIRETSAEIGLTGTAAQNVRVSEVYWP
jgi:hypothetical protein